MKVTSLQGNCELMVGKRDNRQIYVEGAGTENIIGTLKNKNIN